MDLYEHQGKALFASGGIRLSEAHVARTPEEARLAAERLGGGVAVKAYQVRYLTGHLPDAARAGTADLLPRLWEVLVTNDATLVEVNPLALLADGNVMPLDAKVTIDDNALYRHPELAALRSSFP